jgi:hypothetical protein
MVTDALVPCTAMDLIEQEIGGKEGFLRTRCIIASPETAGNRIDSIVIYI